MATRRRPHAKSKLGCTECKQRRVKCDEGRPDCENCRKRGTTTCSFRTFDPVPASSPLAISTTGKTLPRVHVFLQKSEDSPAPLPAQNLTDVCVRDDLLARCLIPAQPYNDVLRHFATNTIPSYSVGAAGQAAWRNALPHLAAKYSFVTRGMLAVGLLHVSHLATTTEETRESYQKKAATQMNAAMDQYRVEIQHISTENADALFAFASMLTLFVLSTSASECSLALNAFRGDANQCGHRDKITSSMLHTVCRVFRSIRGVLVILVPCWSHLQSGPLKLVISRDWPAAIPETENDIENDEKLCQLEKMWSRPDRAYDYSFDTLRLALKSLRESFALVSRLERLYSKENGNGEFDWASVIHWPVQLSLDFLLLLEQQCMEAWVIVAHFAILLAKARDVPWLEGLPENIITAAALVIGEEHWTWIAWPVEAVGLDLKLLQNPVATSTPAASSLHRPSLEADRACPR